MEAIIWLVLLAFLVGLVVATAKNKLVFYNSMGDLVLSFAPWGVMLIGAVIIGFMTPEQSQVTQREWQAWLERKDHLMDWTMIAGLVVAGGVALRSMVINQGFFTGLLVAPFKVLYALFLPLVALASIAQIFGKEKSLGMRALWVTIFGLFWWLTDILVNGDRVAMERTARKWELFDD
ncbi:hypothetical protein SAMN05660443_0633 [Marinospirillum celere]|uniref:Uncharacterized protein n=1 Tax=Marinospirillum celere TaxID=1122252 RepID=A0A1I1EK00_9GAMM|nr:hypothetical protein [Marinospirillum celere]SFB86952.1 hypothetical protein SAMN05660443_0633 [Marinospirillum celere]